MTYQEFSALELDSSFVVEVNAKLRANGKMKGTDDKGKPIYVHPQETFKLRILFEGVKGNEPFERAAANLAIVWQNQNRPKGADWIKNNAGKTFEIKVKDLGSSNSGKTSFEKVQAEITKRKLTDDERAAIIAMLEADRKQVKMDKA